MPFAQWHYPFENKEAFEANFPADFISEAIDQTRGWFYTLLAIGTLDSSAARRLKTAWCSATCRTRTAIKMSKHKGNVVDPWEVLDKQGADAVRWYFYSPARPGCPAASPARWSARCSASSWARCGTPMRSSRCTPPSTATIPAKCKPELRGLDAHGQMGALPAQHAGADRGQGAGPSTITGPLAPFRAFVDELSNWYVRRCRERFWGKGLEGDKLAAFETLYTVLTTLTGLIAPYTPFMAGEHVPEPRARSSPARR